MKTLPFPEKITLKKGSHELPSEGSCAMEVAILAAGYGWAGVQSYKDLPRCMCPVIGVYVIGLNDNMPNDERQRLMAFVTRMSGTKADPETEKMRAEYLIMNAAKPALVSALRVSGQESEARAIEKTKTISELDHAAAPAVADAAHAVNAIYAARYTVCAARAVCAVRAARCAVASDAFDWQPYLDALDGALAIGPQAEPIEQAVVSERVKELVSVQGSQGR